MGRTKLFQSPGSPLIQGHSRTERPFMVDALWATLAAVLFCEAALIGQLWWESGSGGGGPLANWGGLLEALLWIVPVGFIGACAGTGIAVGMGWKRRWIAGAVVGSLFGLAAIAWAGSMF